MASKELPDHIVSRAAEAMYQAQVDEVRRQLLVCDLQLARVREVCEAAMKESDRSAAILLFALAEDLMLTGFKANMNSKVSGGWKSVTEGNGLLATASDRISLIELLMWTRTSTVHDLRLMKSIRNRFAHHSDVSSCSDQKIAGWISTMTDHERVLKKLVSDNTLPELPVLSTRSLFLIRATGTVTFLASDLAVGPLARKAQINPEDVEGASYDVAPEPLKDTRRLLAELMLTFVGIPTPISAKRIGQENGSAGESPSR